MGFPYGARRYPPSSSNDRRARAALGLGCLALTVVACGSRPGPGLWDGSFGTGSCSAGNPGQFTCAPDPGSRLVDCRAAEAGLELVTVGDFTGSDPAQMQANGSGGKAFVARTFYVYVDKSGDAKIGSFARSWETPLVADPFPRCGTDTPLALHIEGGPFLGWGGGVGSSAKDWGAGLPPINPAFDCFKNPQSPFCQKQDVPDYLAGAVVNASQYEGVFLWARRGPDSQAGIRINVGDQDTDDDISFLTYQQDPALPRRCERVRECACTNHQACAGWAISPRDVFQLDGQHGLDNDSPNCAPPGAQLPDTVGGSQKTGLFCGDPAAGVVPGYQATASPSYRCNTCGITRCDEAYEAYPDGAPTAATAVSDAQFNGRPCTAWTSRSGVSSGYCFDPATDPAPAEADQQCGDHFMRGVPLSTDWQLTLVPFTELLQQGFAKRMGKFDPAHVTMLRLTWDGGYVDFWVSAIGFYRRKV
jgi:hypothetical protein